MENNILHNHIKAFRKKRLKKRTCGDGSKKKQCGRKIPKSELCSLKNVQTIFFMT